MSERAIASEAPIPSPGGIDEPEPSPTDGATDGGDSGQDSGGSPPTTPGTAGIDWVATTVQPTFLDAVSTSRGIVAVGQDRRGGVIWLNASGSDWTIDGDDASLDGARLTAVANGGSLTVAVGCDVRDGRCRGAGVWVHSDAWRRAPTGSLLGPAVLADVAVGNGGVVAIGRDRGQPAIFISSDAMAWTKVNLPGAMAKADLRAVTAAGSRFIVVGALAGKPAAWSSPDGATWTASRTPDRDGFMASIVDDGRGLLAAGSFSNPDTGPTMAIWRSNGWWSFLGVDPRLGRR